MWILKLVGESERDILKDICCEVDFLTVDRNVDGSDQGNALRGLQFPRTKTCIEDLVWIFISLFHLKENLYYWIL